MNIINLFLLFYFLNKFVYANTSKMNYNHRLRKLVFKLVILKEKKIPKMVDYLKQKNQEINNKIIVTVGQGITEYENLPYEEKAIIEFIVTSIL
jgi:hypothetical protein